MRWAIFQFQSVTQESAKLLCYLVFGLLCLTSYAPHTPSLLGRCPSSSDVSPWPWPWPWPWPLRPWPWQFLGLPWSWPYEALTVNYHEQSLVFLLYGIYSSGANPCKKYDSMIKSCRPYIGIPNYYLHG